MPISQLAQIPPCVSNGHPAIVMDMIFANPSLCAEWMAKNYQDLGKQVYPVPVDIDKEIARLKLKSMGINLEVLTAEQEKYLASWDMGT